MSVKSSLAGAQESWEGGVKAGDGSAASVQCSLVRKEQLFLKEEEAASGWQGWREGAA